MSLASDLQTYLAAQGHIDGATGWTSVRRRLHDKVDKLVVITEDGGPAPEIATATGLGSAAFRDPAAQVLVRGEPWQSDEVVTKAQDIYDELHGRLAVTLGSTTYDRVVAQSSGPIPLGFDENGRFQVTISFRCAVSQGAPA